MRQAACIGCVFVLGWAWACDGGEVSLGEDPLDVMPGPGPLEDGGARLDAGRRRPPASGHDAAVDAAGEASVRDAVADAPQRDAGDSADAGEPEDAAVGATCSRRSDPPCPKGQFCRFEARAECGVADRTGTCQVPPEGCDDDVDPVCGCDNQTYPNECVAHSLRVSVHYHSDCAGAPGGELGCFPATGCPPGLYCEQGAASCDSSGVCRPSERSCPREIRPVCGCDGVTYDNACLAHAVGRSLDHAGPCASPDAGTATCGGSEGRPCPAGQICDLALGDGCDVRDAYGVCRDFSGGGECPFIYAPVCGCDDLTYSNLCEADVAGMSARYYGECM